MEARNGIRVEGLVRQFKNVRAVDGIDLRVEPGEIYGFLGPNGAGKSTTVHMLTTLLPPTAGAATVGGYDILTQGAAVRDLIGVALQDAALDHLLTGREHMKLQGGLHGLSQEDIRSRGDALLERVGLSDAADRRVGTYSGGMKRRLDLALALVHSPRLLFLDEPTTGLDVQSRAALWDEVSGLAHRDGVTVFLTTQYLEEADQLADRVGIIDDGLMAAEGTPRQLKGQVGKPRLELSLAEGSHEACEKVLGRFGEPLPPKDGVVVVALEEGAAGIAPIIRALDDAGIAVQDLHLVEPSLDDVFLEKTGRHLEGADTAEEPAPEPEPA
jgi:ABC-2 type transport system ATP-binding protein